MSGQDLAFDGRDARTHQGRAAGIVTRTAAVAVDVAVVCVALVLGYAVVNGALFAMEPREFSGVSAGSGRSVVTGLVLSVIYLTVAWCVAGRTYGCRLMGLRVVTSRGTRVGLFAAALRAVLCVCFPFGLLWCAYDRAGRSLQDLALHTRVIYDWRP